MTTLSRKEQLLRAAQLRARITAIMNNADIRLTAKEVREALEDELSALGYNESSLSNFLFTMSNNGLISREGTIGNITYGKAGDILPEKEMKQKKAQKATNQDPTLTVDLVKSTGRVRISFKGIQIEIGVID
jgi:hypothetical protein